MNKAGDTITGDIIMSGNKITDLGSPTDNTDAVTLRYAIGAFARNGYGLGEARINRIIYSESVLDALRTIGWYGLYGYTDGAYWGIKGYYAGVIHVSGTCADDGTGTWMHFYPEASSCELRRRLLSSDVWDEWEYVNPPMVVGEEYRTTERYQGKPVYVKIVNFGALPNASYKAVAHGVENMEYLVYKDCTAGYYHFPVNCDQSSSIGVVDVYVNSTSIQITTTVDWSDVNGYVKLKYTKTT